MLEWPIILNLLVHRYFLSDSVICLRLNGKTSTQLSLQQVLLMYDMLTILLYLHYSFIDKKKIIDPSFSIVVSKIIPGDSHLK